MVLDVVVVGISRTGHAGRGVDIDNVDEEDVIEQYRRRWGWVKQGLYPGTAELDPYIRGNIFVLACLHPPQSPTREAVCRSSDKYQARRLPGVHPEHSTTASVRGSNG
ncbi:hypothetical protein TNCV_952241 [Trichonephila clavipes]|nr:hypothetical protein TNCV_952241 [Trichonephila clavipes]